MTKTSLQFSRFETVAALMLGSLALLILGLQPVLLGELVAEHQITMEGVGIVAMGEIFAIGIGVILAEKFFSIYHLRWIACATIILLAVINLIMVKVSGDIAFTILRMLAGLVEGAMLWLTTSMIVRTAHPDQMAGLFLMVQTLLQALVTLLLARYVMPMGGWQSGFVALAVLTLLSLLLLPFIPTQLTTLVNETTPPVASAMTLFVLAVPFAFLSAIGALWAYMDPLGRAVGFGAIGVQTLIAWVLVLQIIGSAAAILLVRRLPLLITMSVGAVLMGAIALVIYVLPIGNTLLFAMLCLGFGFVWQFFMPFQIRLAMAADPAGRVAMLVPASQLLGCAFGPLIASFSVTGDNAASVPLVSMGFAGLMVVALLMVWRRNCGSVQSATASKC
ncbi:MFS transporter [Aquirhabdus sp.]|uniref:MFS transporter n=1 Tax=Aquirhabdus sp. TaxID=2824160 RepID=UPI00396C7CF6